MESHKDVSVKIRAIRHATGLTQEQFASKLGVTFPTVNRWENNKTKPSPLALQKLQKLQKLYKKLESKNKNILLEVF